MRRIPSQAGKDVCLREVVLGNVVDTLLANNDIRASINDGSFTDLKTAWLARYYSS